MRRRYVFTLVAAALVAGLTAGSLGVAAASTKVVSTLQTSATATAMRPPGGGRGGPGGAKDGGDMLVRVVAKLTGESTTTIAASRAAGTSLAALASTKGVTVDQVVTLAMAADKAALDSEVSNALVSQAEADSQLARHNTEITSAVNATGQLKPPTGPGGPGSSDTSATPPAGPPPARPSGTASGTARSSASIR